VTFYSCHKVKKLTIAAFLPILIDTIVYYKNRKITYMSIV